MPYGLSLWYGHDMIIVTQQGQKWPSCLLYSLPLFASRSIFRSTIQVSRSQHLTVQRPLSMHSTEMQQECFRNRYHTNDDNALCICPIYLSVRQGV